MALRAQCMAKITMGDHDRFDRWTLLGGVGLDHLIDDSLQPRPNVSNWQSGNASNLLLSSQAIRLFVCLQLCFSLRLVLPCFLGNANLQGLHGSRTWPTPSGG